MAEPVTPALLLGPAIGLGALVGLYEAVLIHRDVAVPTHRLGHTVHALLLSMLFVFIVMNTQYVLDLFPALAAIPVLGNVHILRAVVGIIAMIKIHAVSRAISSSTGSLRGLGETWFHSLLVGLLIIAAPYAYDLLNLRAILPWWLNW